MYFFFFCIFQNGTGNACCVHGFTGSLLWFCPSSRWLLCGQSAPSLARLLSYLSLQSSYSWRKKHTIIFILRSVFSYISSCRNFNCCIFSHVSSSKNESSRVSHCAIIQTSKTDVHQFTQITNTRNCSWRSMKKYRRVIKHFMRLLWSSFVSETMQFAVFL